jgi:hypothetical protein
MEIMQAAYATCCMTQMQLAANAAGCTPHAHNLFLRNYQICFWHNLPLQPRVLLHIFTTIYLNN